MATTGLRLEGQRAAVGDAQLAGDEQAKAGTQRVGGKKGFEYLVAQFGWHTGTVVDHMQFYPALTGGGNRLDAHSRAAARRMT